MQYSRVKINDFCTLLVDNSCWGGGDIVVLAQIFRIVIEEFKIVSGVTPPGALVIQPDPGFGNPKCCKTGDYCTIFLSSRGNKWSNYVYQFSHEYCHYLINGPLDGVLETTFWFEESICELASMYFLNRSTIRWMSYNTLRIPNAPLLSRERALLQLKDFAPKNQEYLRDLRNQNQSIEVSLASWLEANMNSLSEPRYQRRMYNQIADSLLDLFIDYPDLWRILPFLSRPTQAEYRGFHEFIMQTVSNRLSVEIEHFPLLVEMLTGDSS